jgi:hypothetical protein
MRSRWPKPLRCSMPCSRWSLDSKTDSAALKALRPASSSSPACVGDSWGV